MARDEWGRWIGSRSKKTAIYRTPGKRRQKGSRRRRGTVVPCARSKNGGIKKYIMGPGGVVYRPHKTGFNKDGTPRRVSAEQREARAAFANHARAGKGLTKAAFREHMRNLGPNIKRYGSMPPLMQIESKREIQMPDYSSLLLEDAMDDRVGSNKRNNRGERSLSIGEPEYAAYVPSRRNFRT